ncbi:S9 family peptidase [Saccharomonospora sp. NB11]|uniref:alpha/beta hydrolase family protein n=1 Tax=Saccharomonospora sp. NB11 TaxID=1642298 RepID=UPI0018D123AD|nr:prolyl oligopeptidase family serine peptidase [Saccharomonospora sp. NB11]
MTNGFERRETETLDRLQRQAGNAGETLSYGPHPDQIVELIGDSGPVVAFVHGGYFRPTIDRSHARSTARALARLGVRVALLEYRRVPGRPWLSVADLDLAEARLRPALWVGHSAGGMLALTRAYGRPTAVLALAPVADLDRAVELNLGNGAVAAWMGGTPRRLPHRYAALNPRRRLTPGSPGVLLMHGRHDATVPVALSEDSPAESSVLPHAHHFDLVDPESGHWPVVLDAVRSSLGAAATALAE